MRVRAATTSARPTRSIRPNGAGSIVSPRRTRRLRVKLGSSRPPMSAIRPSSVARPSRMPRPAVATSPSASRCVSALPDSRRPRAPSTGRLRQLRPVTTSRALAASTRAGSAKSTSMAGPAPRTRRARHRQPAGDPEPGQHGEPPALQREAAGPVGDQGQGIAGDRRTGEAEDHLMRMPGGGVERGRQVDQAGQRREPQGQRQRPPRRRQRGRTGEIRPRTGPGRGPADSVGCRRRAWSGRHAPDQRRQPTTDHAAPPQGARRPTLCVQHRLFPGPTLGRRAGTWRRRLRGRRGRCAAGRRRRLPPASRRRRPAPGALPPGATPAASAATPRSTSALARSPSAAAASASAPCRAAMSPSRLLREDAQLIQVLR